MTLGIVPPLLWLNPLNNIELIDQLIIELVAIAPQHKRYYLANAQLLVRELQQLDLSLASRMKPLQSVPFIVTHPIYHHFLQRYGLQ